ncbi:TolC family protein [Gallionella capsiferriformans]|jgi:outer membrane protein TolC|uniref:Protein CyaE n=1 Tax=Gallionella capsiferriformans (strain ES-2) TaxID=395494 RepID=D9SGX3_GALCS|nr:TolC family protein [Gallionella capsiferriformans]ADL55770.1 outer membrane efflux protein [Gallionella capsiferriformans ES-2]
MYAHLKRQVPVALPRIVGNVALALCILLASTESQASDTSDPLLTESRLTPLAPCTETQNDRTFDLIDIVNTALCNNPQTREVWANSRAQAAQVGVISGGYLPGVSVSVSENQSTPGNKLSSLGLNFSYLLYDFGARAANLENARQLLISVSATQNNTVQTLFLAAVQAYYQTRSTLAAFDASVVSEQAAQESLKVAAARYQSGSTTPADKLTAQTAYSQATLNRITAHGAMKIAQGSLANILGIDANLGVKLASGSTPVDNGQDKFDAIEQSIVTLIETARLNRPDLLAAQAAVKAAQAAADAARAAGMPTLSMTAAANQNNNAGVNTHGSSLGLAVSVPLFSGFTPTYRIRAADAQVESKKAQMDRIRLQIALDVWNAYQNLATASQNRRSTSDLLSSAEQSERVASGRYRAGAGTMLDLLNAQTILASARQQRIQADLNWNISRATLAQAMGSLDAQLLTSLPDVTTSFKP